ncbi:Protein of unknown function [Desulfatibacillum alkenivorans DSM 16219]|jgi:hypothetical protein|uniref:3-deoxy-D-manno-octulosonic acid transferase n=1 Tax=Desulfatibacillum alkenivorans DSM 16219 TaxID=1121393 RepID=A0A1M6DWJ6_9BACT|nr:DUF3800 domain-containing protein [Desulfatibacillum alkenivorans]SHI77616.1 Protein of unknown function [Desulfatibacillum alkenivorans DSM 16219]
MECFDDYIVYVDESGDHGLESIDKNYPVFVLAFCIFKKNSYAECIAPNIVKFKFKYFGHDQVVLHERDIRKSKDCFRILQNSQIRQSFMADLNTLVETCEFVLIASAIDKKRLLDRYSFPNNPYDIALTFGLERVFLFLQSNVKSETGKTHLVFESRGRKEDKDLELEFRRVCSRNATGKALPFEIILADKKTNSAGLQLADLIARPIGRHILKPKQENRAYDVIKKKFNCNQRGDFLGWGLKVFP